jgi:hypothetical protein
VLFKTTDKGYSWEVISPDLTTNDKSKQQTSGGEIYQDNTAAEFHCTILTIAESPMERDVIWIGTDDGNIQITRDGGQSWTNVKDRIKGLPDFSWVGKIHASEHDAGTAFVAVDHHRSDDFSPHAFMTTNYGQSWTKISEALPQDDYVKVVRQDPHYANLLYAGMEHGIFASWNKGKISGCRRVKETWWSAPTDAASGFLMISGRCRNWPKHRRKTSIFLNPVLPHAGICMAASRTWASARMLPRIRNLALI